MYCFNCDLKMVILFASQREVGSYFAVVFHKDSTIAGMVGWR